MFEARAMAAEMMWLPVAALIDGGQKTMLMTKLKIATAILLVVGIIAIPATGLAYRALAGEGPDQKQKQEARGELSGKELGAEKDLRLLDAEVARLKTDIEEMKKRLQPLRKGKAGDGKFVIKVYQVIGLVDGGLGGGLGGGFGGGLGSPVGGDGKSLIRVITKTIEPMSWCDMGGDGSIEYLPAATCLVIRQSPDIQKQVQDLLDAVEKANKDEVEPPGNGAPAP